MVEGDKRNTEHILWQNLPMDKPWSCYVIQKEKEGNTVWYFSIDYTFVMNGHTVDLSIASPDYGSKMQATMEMNTFVTMQELPFDFS